MLITLNFCFEVQVGESLGSCFLGVLKHLKILNNNLNRDRDNDRDRARGLNKTAIRRFDTSERETSSHCQLE